jgi:hypothetical protein
MQQQLDDIVKQTIDNNNKDRLLAKYETLIKRNLINPKPMYELDLNVYRSVPLSEIHSNTDSNDIADIELAIPNTKRSTHTRNKSEQYDDIMVPKSAIKNGFVGAIFMIIAIIVAIIIIRRRKVAGSIEFIGMVILLIALVTYAFKYGYDVMDSLLQ